MPIPTEPVGSLPRPWILQDALLAHDDGEINEEELHRIQDKETARGIEKSIQTGQQVIADGEFRLSSFATYPFVDTLGGQRMHPFIKPGGQTLAIFEDGHERVLPRLTQGPFKYAHYAASKLFATPLIDKTNVIMKASVIAPSMMYLLYPLEEEIEGYPREVFIQDLIGECIEDIQRLLDKGVHRVTIDFTEARLAMKNDPRLPWTCINHLPLFIEMINRVLGSFPVEIRKNIGVHSCAGGDYDSAHSAEVPMAELIPHLLSLNAGYFLLSYSSESLSNRLSVLHAIAENFRHEANGIKQMIYLGVTNPCNPEIETAEDVCLMLVEAEAAIPKDQLGATDDCGFSPFSIDSKPACGGPDAVYDMAFEKMKARVEGANMASRILEV